MNKLSFVKYLSMFAITFVLGFGLTNAFINLKVQNNGFGREEAISHLNKKVQSLCNAKSVSANETQGRTALTENLSGENLILIDWNYSFRGKPELIWYGKEEYEKCVVEVGEAER